MTTEVFSVQGLCGTECKRHRLVLRVSAAGFQAYCTGGGGQSSRTGGDGLDLELLYGFGSPGCERSIKKPQHVEVF